MEEKVVSNIRFKKVYVGNMCLQNQKNAIQAQKALTMLRTSHGGGFGLVGSSYTRIFHPSKVILNSTSVIGKQSILLGLSLPVIEQKLFDKRRPSYFCNVAGMVQLVQNGFPSL